MVSVQRVLRSYVNIPGINKDKYPTQEKEWMCYKLSWILSHLDRRKTQTMVQHTNTKQNWYQVSSSKTSAKAANKELHTFDLQFTCVHLYLFLTWNLIVELIRWPHGLVDGFLLRSFHHFAGCIPQEPKIPGVYSTLVSTLHSTLQCPSSSVQERLPHNCGFPPPLPCWCWSWSAVQLLAAVTMQPPQQPRHHNILSTLFLKNKESK